MRPAFVDEKGVKWDTNAADLEGVMSKKSKWLGEWRERYFILKGPKIFFTKSPTDAPHGIIHLVDCVGVEDVKQSYKDHTLEIIMRSDERFILSAGSKQNKDAWISSINRAIAIATSAHYEEFD